MDVYLQLIDHTNYAYFLHDAESDVMRSIINSLQKFWLTKKCDSSEIPILNTEKKKALKVVENLIKWARNCYEVSIP